MPTIAPIACTAQIRRFSVVTFAALTLAASVSSGLAERLEPSVRQRVPGAGGRCRGRGQSRVYHRSKGQRRQQSD
jgi:hypothetical protein